jgi:lipid II:glycine glycyltransferase (peptidoglycan interpeptide bridge formation enzyme)
LTLVRDRLGEHAYRDFLEANFAADFMQTLAWGRVKSLTGWRSVPLLLQDTGGRVVLSALLLARRLPGLPFTLFYSPRGPVLDWNRPGDELALILKAFVASVRDMAPKHRAVVLKCDPALPESNATAGMALQAAGFRPGTTAVAFEGVQPRFVYVIDIRPDPADLLASFSSKHRYNIRLAQRKGIEVRQAQTEEELLAFYQLLEETAARDRFRVRAYPYFESIWREVVASDGAQLFLTAHGGDLLGGALVFTLGRRGWYVYGASSRHKRNLMPNHALHWEIMLWLKERGFEQYDMRGISGDLTPDSPLYGLYRFKKGFSGEIVEYAGEFDLPLIGPLYLATRVALPVYRSLRRWLGRGRPAAQPDTETLAEGEGPTGRPEP